MTEPNPLAVVTGASSGIGLELAKQLAEHGFDEIVAADDTGLDAAAEGLRGAGVEVRTARADLATEAGVEQLVTEVTTTGRPVDALVINAGVGVAGPFAGDDSSVEDQLRVVDLNVRSSVHLAKRLVPGMVRRGSGRVLFTSSIAAVMPGPFQAVYNASKAFLLSFAEALREELKDSGVTVTALLPGPTDTEFFERAGLQDTKLGAGAKDDPAVVAREGYEAMMAGKHRVVAGSVKNKAQVAAANVVPDPALAAQHRRMSEPGSADS
jgi:short-subunit dehydrogenase